MCAVRVQHTPRRWRMALLLVLVLGSGFRGGKPQPALGLVDTEFKRACAVDDLVPPYGEDISDSWDMESLVEPPFDCTCTTLKAR